MPEQSLRPVGYSFGGMDDIRTFAWLVNALRARQIRIVVADPSPFETVHKLAEELRDGHQLALPVRWHAFFPRFVALQNV